ncbi:MAG TPA: branched-chain amino acid ABC transporter permease [Candidatus Binatia bacterium]|nr:branched-chain amino acid ABC transporter permease [Candidatus Binatia bacterium]
MLTVEIVFAGLLMGSFYALMALGLTLVFGILKIVNFAHGEFFMIGAYAYTLLVTRAGLPQVPAMLSAVVLGAAVGLVMERLLMRPLYTGVIGPGALRDEYAIIVTFGLSIFLINLSHQVLGPYPVKGPDLVATSRMELFGMFVSPHRLLASGLAAATLALIVWLIKTTVWGKRVQAVAQNRFGAAIAGIDHARVSALVLALSGGIVALSGALLSPLFHAYPDVGAFPAVKSFVVVVLGGMGSIPGSILGGLLLGVLENFGAIYVSYEYRDTFGFIILMLVLLLRPQGLFGERAREV